MDRKSCRVIFCSSWSFKNVCYLNDNSIVNTSSSIFALKIYLIINWIVASFIRLPDKSQVRVFFKVVNSLNNIKFNAQSEMIIKRLMTARDLK